MSTVQKFATLFLMALPVPASADELGDQRIEAAIEAHGGSRYDRASYSFTFRGNPYTFTNHDKGFIYTVTKTHDGRVIQDTLSNGTFSRTLDGRPQTLDARSTEAARNALNSVVYFATLPHKLGDEAVRTEHLGRTSIRDVSYDIVGVTFVEQGGGADHDDSFRYWIRTDTNVIDYLAYAYHVNGGGVRFRTATHPRVVGGIRFQNYVNYQAPVGTALEALPALWEAGRLKQLSTIDTENIQVR